MGPCARWHSKYAQRPAVFGTARPHSTRTGLQVQNDPKRGPLVFVRVYSGELRANDSVLNTTKRVRERASRLLKVSVRALLRRAPARARLLTMPLPRGSCMVERIPRSTA